MLEPQLDERWGWHNIIFSLIQKLNSTEKEIYAMNYISVLNWLAYFKEVEALNKK